MEAKGGPSTQYYRGVPNKAADKCINRRIIATSCDVSRYCTFQLPRKKSASMYRNAGK